MTVLLGNIYHRDSIDLKIDKGLRKPCYTTYHTAQKRQSGPTTEHHGKICQVKAVGGILDVNYNSSGNAHDDNNTRYPMHLSQFITADEFDTVLLWVTVEVNNNTVTANSDGTDNNSANNNMIHEVRDYNISPWSNIKLTVSRKLEMNHIYSMRNSTTTLNSNMNGILDDINCIDNHGSNNIVLISIPGDSASTFLYCNNNEKHSNNIYKLIRLGVAPAPNIYTLLHSPDTVNNTHSNSEGVTLDYCGVYDTKVICMDCTTMHVESTPDNTMGPCDTESDTNAPLSSNMYHFLLVGREDGSIDLYDMNTNIPLLNYKPSDHITSKTKNIVTTELLSSSSTTSYAMIAVKWISNTSFVCVLLTVSGLCSRV